MAGISGRKLVNVMTVKLTAIFQQNTQPPPGSPPLRVGGWTESFYGGGSANSVQAAAVANGGLLQCRAALLGQTAFIKATRTQVIDTVPPGPATINGINFQGRTVLVDIPSMSLYCNGGAIGFTNRKTLEIRGIPDSQVVGGEYAPSVGYQNLVSAFFNSLNGYLFRALDLSQPNLVIISVTPPQVGQATAIVVTAVAHGLNVGDKVNLTRLLGTDGHRIPSFVGQVTAPVTTTSFGVSGWKSTLGAIRGRSRKYVIIYPPINSGSLAPVRIGTRKIGRPSELYSGRRRV